jgi:hypothetical protein
VDWPNNRIRSSNDQSAIYNSNVSNPLERSSDEDPMSPDDDQGPEVRIQTVGDDQFDRSRVKPIFQAKTTSRKVSEYFS